MANDLSNQEQTMILVGDVNLRNVTDPQLPFAHVQTHLDNADMRFANCEGCYSDPTVEIPYKTGWFHPDRAAVEGLSVAGFDAVGCANNVHYGADAVLESLANLDRLDIAHSGAGRNREEAHKPAIVEKDGTRFGFLAYTSVFWPVGAQATAEQPGVATIQGHTAYRAPGRIHEMPGAPAIVETWPDKKELADMQTSVQTLRTRVDVLVVSCHWGVSGSEEIVEYQQLIGRAAIDAGADIIIGHHPHVPQGIEVYNNRPIFYSLGNFMFGWEKMKARHPEGLMVQASIKDRRVTQVSVLPIYRNEQGQPRLVSTESSEGMTIVQTVARLSRSFNTELKVEPNKIIVLA